MAKKILVFAAVSAAVSVVLGAFGAHFLDERISAEQLHAFETGVQYQFMHALAILGLGAISLSKPNLKVMMPYRLFEIGTYLFSISLYLLATRDLIGMPWLSKLGMVTPLGGLCFIGGWLTFLFQTVLKIKE